MVAAQQAISHCSFSERPERAAWAFRFLLVHFDCFFALDIGRLASTPRPSSSDSRRTHMHDVKRFVLPFVAILAVGGGVGTALGQNLGGGGSGGSGGTVTIGGGGSGGSGGTGGSGGAG